MSRANRVSAGILAIFMIAAAGAAKVATAAEPGSAHSLTVRFTDLDLHDSAGIVTLYGRIERAARRLCGPRETGGPDIESMIYFYCVNDAVDRAVTQLNTPGLTAYRLQVRRTLGP
jgi:UrcA family protein